MDGGWTAHLQETQEESGKGGDFYRTPDRHVPHVILHLILTKTLTPISQKRSPGGGEAGLGFQLGSVGSASPLEQTHHVGRSSLSGRRKNG